MRALRAVPAAWACALALLMLGPALGRGFVLTFDMVWVPDLAVRSDFLGLGPALPRAVPSDLVVALLDQVLPGMLLQKVVLLGALVAGGLGIARLVGRSVLAQLVAISVYVWSPYVVERLWLGHWPVLLCWAALPWLVREGVRHRDDGRIGAALPFLLLIGSLSANAGLMSAVTLLAVGLTARRGPAVRLVLLVAAANAPWVVAGLLHTGSATTAATGVFALRGEGSLPAPLAALSSGGIWNAAVVPGSRETVLAWVSLLVLLALAAAGVRSAWRRLGGRTAWALLALWGTGIGLAVWSWAAPGSLGWFAAHVPGGGLLRDGSRALALAAPLTAVMVAAGAERVAERARVAAGEVAVRVLVGVGAALFPLAMLPDAAWGISGELAPATYPDEYAQVRELLAQPPPGDLLVLPFTSYRAPEWNHGRRVLDPLPRYLQPNYVVSDELAVDGRILPGEDPRTPEVLDALAEPDAESRARELEALGIGMVARELDVPSTPEYDAPVAGRTLFHGTQLELVALAAPVDRETTSGSRAVVAVAWTAFASVALVGGWNVFHIIWRANTRKRRRR
ncbi:MULTISPECIES: hypothetical protein [unclassified Nocardioides]|uniref:hypothetical protein n=1 Tax=unclassified Nocardioides TaxID=2615069 RepID=UPI000ADEAFBD|nr:MULTISPECIES: hypothetical protein [unclassified Nocardioides]